MSIWSGFTKRTENQELAKALLICLVVVLFLRLFVPMEMFQRGDYLFHQERAIGNSDQKNPNVWNTIAGFLAFDDNSYYSVILLLLGLITPLLLFWRTKAWQTILFYFGTQYFWGVPMMSHTQAMAGVFLLLMLLTKNNWLRLAIFLVGIGTHSMSWLLLGATFLILLAFENRKTIACFPACGSLLGESTPDIAEVHIAGHPVWGFSVATIGNFFLKIMPFPLLLFGIKQLLKEKKHAELALAACLALAPLFWMDRILYLVPLVILPFTGKYCANSTKKIRIGFYLLAFALIILNLLSWWRLPSAC